MRKEKTNRTGNASVWSGYIGYDALGRKHSQVRKDDDFGSIVVPPIGLNAEVAQPLAGGVIEIDPIKPVDPIGPFRPFGEKSRVDYAGNCVYEDRALKMVLIPEGYIKADGIVGEYRYYVRDHQGNVRAVVDGEGNLVEANDYYPYGLPLPAAGGLAGNAQPYKYGGKELLSACHGGDSGADALTGLYDFGPRWQSSPTALWAQPDPEAESYPGISPYAYCAANPARYVDPTGKDIWILNRNGHVIEKISDKETVFKVKTGDKPDEYPSIKLSDSAVEDYFKNTASGGTPYDCFKIRGDEDSTQLFEFLAANTDVEWSQAATGNEGIGASFITTSHQHSREEGMTHVIDNMLSYGYSVREFKHSHPENGMPSGSDHAFAKKYDPIFDSIPKFRVYQPGGANGKGKYVDFSIILEQEFVITYKKK